MTINRAADLHEAAGTEVFRRVRHDDVGPPLLGLFCSVAVNRLFNRLIAFLDLPVRDLETVQ